MLKSFFALFGIKHSMSFISVFSNVYIVFHLFGFLVFWWVFLIGLVIFFKDLQGVCPDYLGTVSFQSYQPILPGQIRGACYEHCQLKFLMCGVYEESLLCHSPHYETSCPEVKLFPTLLAFQKSTKTWLSSTKGQAHTWSN